jgi:O-succinylbenzoic acid--CoA ligase
MLRADGRLALAGRLDDAIRTRDNRVVNLTYVAASLRGIEGVTDALVIPLDSPTGRTFGAVIECEPGLTIGALRAMLADRLPPWSWPRTLELVPALPRLPNGKPDRRACATLLGGAPGP